MFKWRNEDSILFTIYGMFYLYVGDPITVGAEREWQEALRLYTYNQDNELFLHSKWTSCQGQHAQK